MGILFDRPDPAAVRNARDGNLEMIVRVSELLTYDRRARELRRVIFDTAVINDSCWHILQDLFAAHLAGAEVRTKHLHLTTGLPQTTVLRYLDHLETFDAVIRASDDTDSRVTLVSLTPTAVDWMFEYYEQLAENEANDGGPTTSRRVGAGQTRSEFEAKT